jgi:membrane-bound lytic murein transglycosylase D
MEERVPMTDLTTTGRPRLLLLAALAALAVLAGCATALPPQVAPPDPAAAADAAEPVPPQPPAAAEAAASAPPATAAPAAAPAVEPASVRDPLRPEVSLSFDDDSAHADLWLRLRRGFTMPDLDSQRVRMRERWYASRPDYVQRMTERSARYLFHIVEEVDRRGLPMELALLPFIESAFNPQAMSSAKASGMWQFIPSTGRNFDLTQNLFRDERRDVLASTRAALDYLTKLYGMFGDWHLALAAYNWGEGSVQRAIAYNRKRGRPTDYESLRMPAETADYVPKLQAVKNIVLEPASFGLEFPPLANHPHFVAVPIERDIDVEVAARLADVPLDEFRALNPQMNKPVILAAGTPYLLLPYDNANLFVKGLGTHRGPLAHWTAWVAPKTLRPAEAAKLHGMDEAELREVNRIPAGMLIKAGSTLLVPRDGQRTSDVSEHVADNAVLALASEGRPARRVTVKAGRNDSVASIARRYRVSAAQVAQWNDVATNARFRAGQSVVIVKAAPAGRAVARGKAAKSPLHPTRTAATPSRTTRR